MVLFDSTNLIWPLLQCVINTNSNIEPNSKTIQLLKRGYALEDALETKTKLSNDMKGYLQILEEAAEKQNIYGIVPDLRFRLDEQTMDLIEKAADIYATQSNSHKPVVMQAEGSDGVEGAAVASEGREKHVSVELTEDDIKWLHQKPVDTDWIKGYDRA